MNSRQLVTSLLGDGYLCGSPGLVEEMTHFLQFNVLCGVARVLDRVLDSSDGTVSLHPVHRDQEPGAQEAPFYNLRPGSREVEESISVQGKEQEAGWRDDQDDQEDQDVTLRGVSEVRHVSVQEAPGVKLR